jgi:hypothetical protein
MSLSVIVTVALVGASEGASIRAAGALHIQRNT